MPAITVIIPTFNRSAFAKRATISVLKQSFNDFEVIVVDDGSTDDTDQVIQALGPKVRYIWQENQGVATARNSGIEIAKGDYIAFLDSDDSLLQDHLKLLYTKLSTSPNVDIVHCWAEIVESNGRRYQRMKSKLRGSAFRNFLFSNPVELGTLLFRRTCFERSDLFDPTLTVYEDWDMWLRLSAKHSFDYVPHVLTEIHYEDPRRSSICSAEEVGESVSTMYNKLINNLDTERQVFPFQRRLRANLHVLKGHHYRLYTQDHLAAKSEFLKAISIAPHFSRGYIGLLECLIGQELIQKMQGMRSNFLKIFN